MFRPIFGEIAKELDTFLAISLLLILQPRDSGRYPKPMQTTPWPEQAQYLMQRPAIWHPAHGNLVFPVLNRTAWRPGIVYQTGPAWNLPAGPPIGRSL
jgi:hypothetical protein